MFKKKNTDIDDTTIKNQSNNQSNIKLKPPFILSDVFVGIVSIIPMVNFVTPILLLIRNRRYNPVNKWIIKEKFTIIDLNNEKEKLILDTDRLKEDYKRHEQDLINENEKLKEDYKKLEQNLINENEKLSARLTKKYNQERITYENEIKNLEDEYDKLRNQVIVEYINDKDYSNISSEDMKNKLALLKLREKDLVQSNGAFDVKGSVSENRKQTSALIKQITKCFTAESTEILNNLTINNVEQSRNKLIKSYETTNKAFEIDHINLTEDYLKLKLDELSLNFEILKKIQEEKEIRQQEKEILREEEKVRREIEREKIKIEKEEKQFKNEVSKLMSYMNKASNEVEKQIYIDKIKELESKIELLEVDKKNVFDREQNTRAGYVYIISNIGSFGENIYKIGMTRRLEPMDRIRELSSASVPFEFDVHAMIFSEDAPKLENILHEHFRENAINKVNLRKEFYNIDLDEAKKVVYDNFNNTVDFNMSAKAEEFRQSIKISEENKH